MAEHLLPALFALFVWWFSTGAILWLDGLPARTYRTSMAVATLVCGLAFWGTAASAADASVIGAYCAFSCGLLAWGWQEMAFLMGYATGPNQERCPEGLTGWPRFTLALKAILWHELAIIAGAAALVALTWGQPNQVALHTYLLIWGMRQSAKLNVFFGARNLSEQFLPPHLKYLGSYFMRKPMNLFFPLAVTCATLLCALLFHRAFAADATAFEAAGFTFLGVLTALAVLEHWFLVLPIPAEALWNWGLTSRKDTPAAAPAPAPQAERDPVAARMRALRPGAAPAA
jgi:putative photosynthetic complex assembly protein 2